MTSERPGPVKYWVPGIQNKDWGHPAPTTPWKIEKRLKNRKQKKPKKNKILVSTGHGSLPKFVFSGFSVF